MYIMVSGKKENLMDMEKSSIQIEISIIKGTSKKVYHHIMACFQPKIFSIVAKLNMGEQKEKENIHKAIQQQKANLNKTIPTRIVLKQVENYFKLG